MSETSSESGREQRHRQIAADAIGYSALQRRIERYQEHVGLVQNDQPRDYENDYIYTNPELAHAYEEADTKAQAVIKAYMEYQQSVSQINHIRIELEHEHEKEKTRRDLGTDVLNITGIEVIEPTCDSPAQGGIASTPRAIAS
jgi:hypothetical protein